MGLWRHPRTRDGRLALAVVLPTGMLDRKNDVRAEISESDCILLTFAWPRVLIDADSIMRALISFTSDFRDGRGPILALGLRDFIDPLQAREGENVYSTCTIQLSFLVKPDIKEDVIQFEGEETSILYVKRF